MFIDFYRVRELPQQEQKDLVDEQNGVKLFDCGPNSYQVEWHEGAKRHQSVFWDWTSAQACYFQRVEEAEQA